MIKFTIIGKPKQQQRHRPSARGGYYDPSSKDKKQIWLQIAKFKPKQPFVGDISLKVTFYMPRPKSHYRTGKYKHLLKDNIPEYVSVRPDLDNYCKLLLDLLQGKDRYFIDDSQVVKLQAEKVYGRKGRTEVFIEEI